jgi:segregation and condensation protein B
MSLKAKLEAVIYAAEEPVTLAQLAALFATEAFEWKEEQSVKSAQALEAAQTEIAEHLSLIPSELVELGIETGIPEELVPSPAIETTPAEEPGQESALESTQTDGQEAGQEAEEPAGQAAGEEPGLESAQATLQATLTQATLEVIPPPTTDAAPAAETPAQTEQEARRLARQRDREVRAILRQIIDDLVAEYEASGRGIEIREIAGGYRMATKPECHDAVRLFVKSLKPPLKLSLPALETLAVIAYKQPVTAPEVNEIRGVDSSGVFGSLIARKLIATAGRKQVIGRPMLYKTTREFLLRFGLNDVAELPSMEEFEKMAAIELEEPEAASNEDPGASDNLEFGPELDENASEEAEGDIPANEEEPGALTNLESNQEMDENASEVPEGDRPANESEAPAPSETAETAASDEVPPSEEAAPAAPHSPEQVETENSPHDEEVREEQ